MKRAFVFPGQGSQTVGMGQELAAGFAVAREVFEEVDDALGQALSKVIAEGPQEVLTRTDNAQPALMAVSFALVRVLESEGGFTLADKAAFVAGHSLGEYAALTATGALPLSDCARLLKIRGQAMQAAVPVGQGAMAALLGLDFDQAVAVAKMAAGDEVCAAANDNAKGQVVVSGSKAAVERAVRIAKEQGAKKAVLLPVSAPFHCALMQPAAERMADALNEVRFAAPSLPVVANVTAEAVSDPEKIKDLLITHICGTVRWRESVLWMHAKGVEQLVELGSGKVLSGLVRRIERSMTGLSVNDPAGIEALLKEI